MTTLKPRNIKLLLEYEGTHFQGWQSQAHKRTIQDFLELIIGKIVNHRVKLITAGRTDSGVHAKGQVINFHTTSPISLSNLIRAINTMAKPDIVILSAEEVSEKFNARKDAQLRWYRYRILNRNLPSVFESGYSFHYRYPLDIEKMQKAGNCLIGRHDFTSFNGSPKLTENPIRTVKEFTVTREGDMIYIDIKAHAYLHHMVRTIVGTLIEIGRGKMKYTQMKKILDSKDRKKAGSNVPPQGLFLMEVKYQENTR